MYVLIFCAFVGKNGSQPLVMRDFLKNDAKNH